MKLCRGCDRELPEERFSKDRGKRDGFCSRCKDCDRERRAKYYTENREAIREYNAKYRAENPDYFAKWCAENRERNANRVQDPDATKRCRTCTEEKPETAFSLNRTAADGLQRDCKDCDNSAYRRTCSQAHGEPENTICHLCGLPNDADAWVDHLHPQSLADEYEGDIHCASNLRWAHAECNISRSNRPLTDEQLARIYGRAA